MPLRRSRTRRSAAAWAIRGTLAIGAAGLGYVSVAQTLGYGLRTSAPARAHALAPTDGRVTAALASSLSGVDASAADRRRADDLARLALRQDPTAVTAISTLGLNAQSRADTTHARRMFAYAQTLSRRDLQTQIWAIEDAVGRGDITAALKHYDIALRTSRNAADLLFPILGTAMVDPTIRRALTLTLAARPAWGAAFVEYVAGNGPEPRTTAQLYADLSRKGIQIPDGARTAVINGLIANGFINEAWAYHASYTPGADRRRARDPRFTAVSTAPSPFDWVVLEDAGLSASIQHGDTGGVFDFSATSGVGGPLLRQMQLLPAGDYILDGHSSQIEQPASSTPYWILTCRDGRELGRVVVPNSLTNGGNFMGRIRVPADCPIQTLTLMARPSDAVAGVSGQIDRVRLFPADRQSR